MPILNEEEIMRTVWRDPVRRHRVFYAYKAKDHRILTVSREETEEFAREFRDDGYQVVCLTSDVLSGNEAVCAAKVAAAMLNIFVPIETMN
jgi:hypothetical protein